MIAIPSVADFLTVFLCGVHHHSPLIHQCSSCCVIATPCLILFYLMAKCSFCFFTSMGLSSLNHKVGEDARFISVRSENHFQHGRWTSTAEFTIPISKIIVYFYINIFVKKSQEVPSLMLPLLKTLGREPSH